MNGLIIIQTAPTEKEAGLVALALVGIYLLGIVRIFYAALHSPNSRIYVGDINAQCVKLRDISASSRPRSSSKLLDVKTFLSQNPCLKLLPFASTNEHVRQEDFCPTYFSPSRGLDGMYVTDCIHPRLERGKKYDNIRGIIVNNKFVLLREVFINGYFPEDIGNIIKLLQGRLPTAEEFKMLYEFRNNINLLLDAFGEPLLNKGKYLCTGNLRCGEYCLFDFTTGEVESGTNFDIVSACLVIDLPKTINKQ